MSKLELEKVVNNMLTDGKSEDDVAIVINEYKKKNPTILDEVTVEDTKLPNVPLVLAPQTSPNQLQNIPQIQTEIEKNIEPLKDKDGNPIKASYEQMRDIKGISQLDEIKSLTQFVTTPSLLKMEMEGKTDVLDLDESLKIAAVTPISWIASARKAVNLKAGVLNKTIEKYGWNPTNWDQLTKEEKIAVEKEVDKQEIINFASGNYGMPGLGLSFVPPKIAVEEYKKDVQDDLTQYDGDILTSFQKGNFFDAGARILNGSIQTAPTLAAAATGYGGIAAMTAGMYGENFTENYKNNPEQTLGMNILNSGLKAGIEGVGAIATNKILFNGKIINNLIGSKSTAGKKAVSDVLNGGFNRVKSTLGGMVLEGGEEWSTELAADFANEVTNINKFDTDQMLENMANYDLPTKMREKVDAAILGAAMGGGTKTIQNLGKTESAIKEHAVNLFMSDADADIISKKGTEINDLQQKLGKAETDIGKEIIERQINNKAQEIAQKRKSQYNNLKNLEPKELIELGTEIDNKNNLLKNLQKETDPSVKQEIEKDLKESKKKAKNLFNNATKRRVQENVATARKSIGAKNVKVHTNPDTFQNIHDESTGADPKESIDVSGVNAFYVNGTMHINKTAAIETDATSVGTHENLHDITKAKINDTNGRLTPDGRKLIDDFRSQLSAKEIKVVDQRINDNYKFDENGKEKPYDEYAEEYLNQFHDAVVTGDIKYNATDAQWWKDLANSFTGIFKKEGFENVNFETGQDAYNFLQSYNKAAKEGKTEDVKKLSTELKKQGRDLDTQIAQEKNPQKLAELKRQRKQKQQEVREAVANESQIKKSDTKENEINQLGRNVTKAEWDGGKADQAIGNIYEKLQGLIKSKIPVNKPPGFSETDFVASTIGELIPHIRNFNPEVNDSLSGWINSQLSNKIGNVFKKGTAGTKAEFEQDISEARGVAVEQEVEQEVDKKQKVTKKVLSKEFNFDKKDKATTEVMKSKDFKMPDSYKSVKDMTPELTAELFGVDPKQYVDPKKSLKKEDVIAARTFIRKNPELLYNMLPEALNEQGKSTGVRKLLLDAFYEGTGVRKEAALGRSKQGSEVRTKKPFNQKEFLSALGIIPGEVMKVKNQTKVSGMISALMNETGKAMTNQAIKNNLDADLQKEVIQKIDDGKNRILYSDTRDKSGVKETLDKQAKPEPVNKSGTKKMVDFLTGPLAKVLPYDLIIRSGNLAAAGNDAARAIDRGFRFIGNFARTKNDADRKPTDTYKKEDTFKYLNSGIIADLAVVNALASNTKYEGNTDTNNMREAIRGKNKGNIDKNIANLDSHKKGVKEILTELKDLYKKYPNQVRELLYNANANASFNRNFASLLDMEFNPKNLKTEEEHVFQAGRAAIRSLEAMGKSDKVFNNYLDWLADNYYQVALTKETADIVDKSKKAKEAGIDFKSQEHPLLQEGLDQAMKDGDFSKVPSSDIRYFNEYHHINPNTTGYAKKYNLEVDKKHHNNADVVEAQADLIFRQIKGEITPKQAKAEMDSYLKLVTPKKSIKYSTSKKQNESNKEYLQRMKKLDKALEVARDPNAPEKGISIFDFDQTLANTKEKVIVTTPDGKTKKIGAQEFAEKAAELEEQGAEFDFKEFEKVKGATKGPFFDLAQKIKGKFGNKDIFILTARPQSSDIAIQSFLKAVGLDIKLENITGLEDGTPQAKADFVIDKVADGYNNFFFGDDAYKNVKAVQEVLDQVDVKRDVQQAKEQLNKDIDTVFDEIIQENTGLNKNATVSVAKAKQIGATRGSWLKDFFLAPSSEDFTGLMYTLIGKGKKGEKQFEFIKNALIRPFARGIRDLNAAKQVISNEFANLKKIYPDVTKSLRKPSPVKGYNNSHAIRVYLWNKNGIPIPGLSKTDEKALVKHVNNNSDMKVFADQAGQITKLKEGYTTPSNSWMIGNISTDMQDVSNKVKRSEYLKEYLDNYEKMFTPERLNKLELIYGSKFVEALNDMKYRMEYGTNRSQGQDRITAAWQNWVNNSVGAIMFFNMRSAVLQTLSSVNFVNWNDNNPFKAAKALANQKQYWKDFSYIFNHPTLKQRRAGLDIDVNASEIAARVADSKNKISAGLNHLLQLGFTPTRIADSFAIASGGATFYRNRIETYVKQGLSKKRAEEKAFLDFQEISEATQQSARPDMISQQQAGPLGRLVLAFQVTPMQYTRLMKRSVQDLVAGRGDMKTHVSKIIYYGAVQNMIFNALQSAVFALAFGDDEEDDEDKMSEKEKRKAVRVANNMADSLLRGLGVQGAAVATVKNMIIKFLEQEKRGYRADHAYTMIEGLNISPPIGSKARKVYSATQTYKFNRDAIKEMGFDIDNPAYEAVGNIVSGTTNVPLDRVIANLNNVRAAMDKNNAAWQRISVLLGWNAWDVGIPDREVEKVKQEIKKRKAEERKRKKSKK